jgi:ppGpp synthetase/RelA/SpoT-type nucleotidyltranferase
LFFNHRKKISKCQKNISNKIINFYNKYSVFRLNELLPIIIKHLEFELKKNGIPARVAGRVKNPASLKEKLLNWSKNP